MFLTKTSLVDTIPMMISIRYNIINQMSMFLVSVLRTLGIYIDLYSLHCSCADSEREFCGKRIVVP